LEAEFGELSGKTEGVADVPRDRSDRRRGRHKGRRVWAANRR